MFLKRRNKEDHISIATSLLSRQRNYTFFKNIITSDEKCIFSDNIHCKSRTLIRMILTQKAELYGRKFMVCVWWDHLSIIHFKFFKSSTQCRLILSCPVGWSCRIHWLLLCRGVGHLSECPGYDTEQSHGEVPVMLKLWWMQITPLLPSLPGPLWPRVVAPDKGPIYGLNKTKPWFLEFTVWI